MATAFSISFNGDSNFLYLSKVPDFVEKMRELFSLAVYIEELDNVLYYTWSEMDAFMDVLIFSSEVVFFDIEDAVWDLLDPVNSKKLKSLINSNKCISLKEKVCLASSNQFLDIDTLSFLNFGARFKEDYARFKLTPIQARKKDKEMLKIVMGLYRVWFCDNLITSFSREPKGLRDRSCFFCGKPIVEGNSKEHIIPDSFLGEWNLKNQKMHFGNDQNVTYSRLKVNSHSKCNNEFGSRYEEIVLNILRNIKQHEEELLSMHHYRVMQGGPSDDCASLLTAWFSKIFYGIFWFQLYQLKDVPFQLEDYYEDVLENLNFNLVRKSYQWGQGFILPSSIYYFKLKQGESIPFDFGFKVEEGVFWLKLKNDFFMMAISDGQLCYQFLDNHLIDHFYMRQDELEDSFFYTHILSHLIAVRRNLPKKPSFMVSDNSIINMSLSTMSTKGYQINSDKVNREAHEIRLDLLSNHLKLKIE